MATNDKDIGSMAKRKVGRLTNGSTVKAANTARQNVSATPRVSMGQSSNQGALA